jgi:AraC family transcriptional regulator of adaptative response/methylated-DNA-[protein]-cysteine methyltransferase
MSPYHFHRRFKQLTGLTPKGYASAVRTSRLRRTLRGATSVTTAAYDAGFASSTRFYAGAKKALGMQPARYKKGGAGTTLRVATSPSPLGVVLVAATEIGVAAIFLGDDRKSLDEALQARFPKAEKIAADKELAKTLARVVSLIEHPASSDLPLDIRGTAFEHKVWTALQEIPIGTTASYAEVAKRIGAPKAVRAVARACAANSIAIAVPCHRVVGSDGNLTGYRWGIERKRQLLASEARIAARRTPAPRKRKG